MNIAIYCGSSFGNNPIYEQETKKLARKLADSSMGIIYGGSIRGLMGVISNESLKCKNIVTGVITYDLVEKEIENTNITKIYRVNTINERKEKMEELADGFIALPGGYGTLEEIFEVLTSAQIGYHKKPCAFLNVNGYYDTLKEFLSTSVKEGFISQEHLDMIIITDDIDEMICRIKNYIPPKAKWANN